MKPPSACDKLKAAVVAADKAVWKQKVFSPGRKAAEKKHREAVYKILNSILETGRHTKTSCINTNHLPTNKGETRRILNESHIVVYFPHSGSVRGVNYLLTEYVGLSKKEIIGIKKMPSRWCCIFKNYPQIIMTEKSMWFVGENPDEE